MSSLRTPSMTSTYSPTPTIILEYTYTVKPQPRIVQNSSNSTVLNTPLIVLIMSIISITIICIIYNIVCFNIKKRRREVRERIIEDRAEQITVFRPIIIHENPLHSVYRVHL